MLVEILGWTSPLLRKLIVRTVHMHLTQKQFRELLIGSAFDAESHIDHHLTEITEHHLHAFSCNGSKVVNINVHFNIFWTPTYLLK